MIRKQIIFPLIKEICEEEGINFIQEPSRGKFGVLIFKNGRKFFVKDVNFNLNYTPSTRITKNKALASYFLEKFGYCVPKYTMVYSKEKCQKYNLYDTLEKGLEFADKIGYPIILKLNDSSQGRGVYKIYDRKDLAIAATKIFQQNDTFQIQKYYNYNDYRVVVLGEEVLSAYQRIPLHITGDGKSSIKQLIAAKQNEFILRGRDTIIKIDDDVTENLSKLGFSLETILSKNQKCILKSVSNLSAGGESLDLTDKIHSDYKKMCVDIAKDFNLNLVGIDIMCNNICERMNEHVILELNSAPGLDNYAFQGKKQEKYIKDMYRKVIFYIQNTLCKGGIQD